MTPEDGAGVGFRDAATAPPDDGFPASPSAEDIAAFERAVEDGATVPKALRALLGRFRNPSEVPA